MAKVSKAGSFGASLFLPGFHYGYICTPNKKPFSLILFRTGALTIEKVNESR